MKMDDSTVFKSDKKKTKIIKDKSHRIRTNSLNLLLIDNDYNIYIFKEIFMKQQSGNF